MCKYIWEGSKVRLRPIMPCDWEKFHENDMDTEVSRLCDAVHKPRSPEGTRLWAERSANEQAEGDNARFAIETLAGELIGSINAHSCDPKNGTFKYGLGIFRNHWRRGYGSEAIMILLQYYFHELRYQKATAHVYAFNNGSIQLHGSLGFQHEGRLRRMVYTQGQYFDEILFGMTKEEFDCRTTES